MESAFHRAKPTGSEKWCLQGMASLHRHPKQPVEWGGFGEERVDLGAPGGDAGVFNFNLRGQRGSGFVHEEQGLDFSVESNSRGCLSFFFFLGYGYGKK